MVTAGEVLKVEVAYPVEGYVVVPVAMVLDGMVVDEYDVLGSVVLEKVVVAVLPEVTPPIGTAPCALSREIWSFFWEILHRILLFSITSNASFAWVSAIKFLRAGSSSLLMVCEFD